ncbi:MAG: hypothetical protein V4662_27095 [Verrucomicrobiota bacterium]
MSRFFLLFFLYVGLASVWVWRLQPTAPDTAEDPQRAPRLEKLTTYLTKAPASVVKRILMSISFMPDQRLAQVDAWLSLPPMQQLRELTIRESAMLKGAGTLRDSLLLGWLGQEDTAIITNEAHLMIAASGGRLDDQMRLYAFEVLASRARAEGDLESAMMILDRAAELPRATWAISRSYVQIARSRELHSAALVAITDWLKKAGEAAPASDLDEARELQVQLLVRLSRAEEALDLQLQRLQAIPADAPVPETTLSRALVCARASHQQALLLPWIERLLASFPENTLKPEALLTSPDLDDSYLLWLKEYAVIVDRELPPARAFEVCLRLAATGERGALSRVCALAEDAKALPAATAFLQLALGQPALRPAVLDLAQQDALARRIVTEALRKAPADHDLHFASTLAEAAATPASAAFLWQSYLHRFPSDAPAQRRLIHAHLTARQPDLALRVFESIDPQSLTDADKHQREVLSQL